ncbi:hypothetical protein B0H16DRAFT_1529377 [Mycena metata]|uniref:F-box domain-containing protein n=1 Tax=Mycena metata TaxID=1033252 RepID=A0AAD7JDI6_9AGAR|nr:hypothetical protein B0H16DRAFT_1529377 [Mycena metata]
MATHVDSFGDASSVLTNHKLRLHAASLDTKIAILRAQVDELLKQRAAAQEGLDAITYPVLTLPVEIISKIFFLTLCAGGPYSELTVHGKSLILGHICQLWRQIALSTPELWNTIQLKSRGGLAPALIHTFLSRAASLPLSILVLDFDVDQDMLNMALSTVMPHSRNWAHLSIAGGAETMRRFQVVHQQLPQLQSLELLADELQPTISDDTFGTMFQHAPLLRKVHLKEFGLQRFALPWSQLTSLHISHLGQDLAEILSWTPNLVDLILGDADPVFLPPLPYLQSIIFADTIMSAQTEILSRLRTPIRRLKMVILSDLAPFAPPMAHPSSLDEVSLDIIPSGFVKLPSIECLAVLTSVRTLKLTAHGYSPSYTNFSLDLLIDRLIKDAEFLPALESLTIVLLDHNTVHIAFDGLVLAEMLAVRGLRNFELLSHCQVPDLGGKAEEFKAKGMRIHMQTVPNLDIRISRPEF